MPNRAISLALFSALILSAPQTLADEILITQAKALAGNVTPGDAAGFPVTLSLPGKYRLTTNLYPTAEQTGIYAAQRNITIDLDGFELHGAGVAANGITGVQPGATIRKGTVTGFKYHGIFTPADFWIVENMRVVANGISGITCADACLVQGSIIAQNGDFGVALVGEGATVLGNSIFGNGSGGIAGFNTGYGNNTLHANNLGSAQVSGSVIPFHPNACSPACP